MRRKQKKLYEPKMVSDERALNREIKRINRATMFDNIFVKIFACIIIAFAEANIIYVVLRDTLEMGVVESITIILAVALVLVFLPHSIGHMYAERYYEKNGNTLLFTGAMIFYILTLTALIVPRIFFYLERSGENNNAIVDMSGRVIVGADSGLTSIANMSMVGVLFIVMISCGFVLALISFKSSDPIRREIIDLTVDKFYVEQEIRLRKSLNSEFRFRVEQDEALMREEDKLQLKSAVAEIYYVTERIRQNFLLELAKKRNNPEEIADIMEPKDTEWIDNALKELGENEGKDRVTIPNIGLEYSSKY